MAGEDAAEGIAATGLRSRVYARIGEVARQAGVSVRALRYSGEQDLLPCTRSARGSAVFGFRCRAGQPDPAALRRGPAEQVRARGAAVRVLRHGGARAPEPPGG
ncbi:MerR family transcriptional regulator [Streptomyces sp. NPDC058420]|uniref:MerR family transcriptional regulator n=1 Tax=Streptomyces sp. NPDC058420 TaxID=3346489 RepID=UPI0036650740